MAALAGVTARCAGTFSAPRPSLHPRHNAGPAPARPGPTSRPQQLALVGALPTSLPRPLPSEGGGAGSLPAPEVDPSSDRGSFERSSSPDWPSSSSSSSGSSVGLKPLPRNVEGVADDVNLANPLQVGACRKACATPCTVPSYSACLLPSSSLQFRKHRYPCIPVGRPDFASRLIRQPPKALPNCLSPACLCSAWSGWAPPGSAPSSSLTAYA